MQSPPPFATSLCHKCKLLRLSGNRRGSVFLACEYNKKDPNWPRYPGQPVKYCPQFIPAETH